MNLINQLKIQVYELFPFKEIKTRLYVSFRVFLWDNEEMDLVSPDFPIETMLT